MSAGLFLPGWEVQVVAEHGATVPGESERLLELGAPHYDVVKCRGDGADVVGGVTEDLLPAEGLLDSLDHQFVPYGVRASFTCMT